MSIGSAQIIDLAPTVLYAMAESIPADVDGVVLTEAFHLCAAGTRHPGCFALDTAAFRPPSAYE